MSGFVERSQRGASQIVLHSPSPTQASLASIVRAGPYPRVGNNLFCVSRHVGEPIVLPNGKKLRTLKDAIAWLAKEVPEGAAQDEAGADRGPHGDRGRGGGPMKFARIGMMQAINRHHVEEFDTSRKTPHWGRRKLNATNAGVRLGSNWRQLKN